jgi:hypothetical protein
MQQVLGMRRWQLGKGLLHWQLIVRRKVRQCVLLSRLSALLLMIHAVFLARLRQLSSRHLAILQTLFAAMTPMPLVVQLHKRGFVPSSLRLAQKWD